MFEMLFGITIFALGSIFPILREELKERLVASRTKPVDTQASFSAGFDAGFNEAMYEVKHTKKEESTDVPLERSYFVSEGFSEEDWINSMPTPPKADTDVSDAYMPSLHNIDVEIITDDREQELYKRANLGGV